MDISQPTYICPIHGEVTDCISSNIKGNEGMWCMVCVIELLNKNVCKVTVKESPNV